MRAHIFIDGANIYHGARDYQANEKINYQKLVKLLTQETNTEVLRTHYYTGVPENITEEQQRFLNTIERLPNFEIKTKPLREVNGKRLEKGVDVLIATDMLWNGLEKHYEQAILCSGDEDLAPAVKRLKDAGLIVTVAAYKKSASHELVAAADTYVDLARHQEELHLD